MTVDTAGIVTVTGWLSTTTRVGDTYPLVSARAAFDRLTAGPFPMMAIACPDPAPGTGTGTGTITQDPALPGCGGPLTVTGARLGLSLEQSTDGPLLVPAWLFTVDGSPDPLTAIAVDPAFWGSPDDPVPPSPSDDRGRVAPGTEPGGGIEPVLPTPASASIAAAHVIDGGAGLDLTIYGAPADGPCAQTYDASARESDDVVIITVVTTAGATTMADCPALAAERHVSVRLQTPLGSRQLIDAATGAPVRLGPVGAG